MKSFRDEISRGIGRRANENSSGRNVDEDLQDGLADCHRLASARGTVNHVNLMKRQYLAHVILMRGKGKGMNE